MIRVCLTCKNKFNVHPYKLRKGKGKYCSKDCYLASIKRVKVSCKNCGKDFLVSEGRFLAGRGKYCSKKCQYLYTPRQKKVSCKYCNKVFKVKMSETERGGGIYCSRECAAKDYKNHYSGENAPNWKGGKQREKHNGDYRYSDWRLSVYERDRFTCQICDIKGGKLNAHHLFKWSKFPSLRYELWNGITLCEKCHKGEHKKGGNYGKSGDKGKLQSGCSSKSRQSRRP